MNLPVQLFNKGSSIETFVAPPLPTIIIRKHLNGSIDYYILDSDQNPNPVYPERITYTFVEKDEVRIL
jgi:hypothetical protein